MRAGGARTGFRYCIRSARAGGELGGCGRAKAAREGRGVRGGASVS